MTLILHHHPKKGTLTPLMHGRICPECSHSGPLASEEQQQLPSGARVLAHQPSDVLFMTGPQPGPNQHPHANENLLTLYSLDGFPPHVMLLLTSFLRQKCREARFRKVLQQHGIGVISTHDPDPAVGHMLTPAEIEAIRARVLPHMQPPPSSIDEPQEPATEAPPAGTSLVVTPHPTTGKLVPQIRGQTCPGCQQEVPGSANSLWEHPLTHPGANKHLYAQTRTDLLKMTGPKPGINQRPEPDDLLLTLYSLDGSRLIMDLLTQFLRQKCRESAFQKELAQHGIGIASTHDDEPAPGYQAISESAHTFLRRITAQHPASQS